MKPLAPPLALVLLCAMPAYAEVEGEPRPSTPHAPTVPLAPGGDEPRLTVLPVPVPWLLVGALATYEDLHWGPTRSSVKLLGGYFWSHDQVFDPASTSPLQPAGVDANAPYSNRWRLAGQWDIRLGDGWTLGPAGHFLMGGLINTGSYDPTLAGGESVMAGPILRYTHLDESAFPTSGLSADFGYAYGEHWGDETFGFHEAGFNAVQYLPLGPNRTVALRASMRAGYPKLAWLDKLNAGGGDFVRGYAWNRFTGDRLATASVEYRQLVFEDLLDMVGWHHPPIKAGLAYTLQLDAGRVWEGREGLGLPLGSDLRVGGGVGLLTTINRAPFGRFELDGSAEGLVPVAGLGTSF